MTTASSILGDWLGQESELLTRLYQLMHRRLLLSRATHGDADYPDVLFDFTTDKTAVGHRQLRTSSC